MDISLEKLELIKKITETENISVLKKIKNIFKKEQKDFWDELSDEQKEAVEESKKQFQNGDFEDYNKFIKEYL